MRSRCRLFSYLPILLGLLLPAQPAVAIDPCSLITRQEAADILGEEVQQARPGMVNGFAAGLTCTYFTAAPLEIRGGTGSVDLVIHDRETMIDGMYDEPAAFFDKVLTLGQQSQPDAVTLLDNLGDRAFWQAESQRLHLLFGERYFILSIRDLITMTSDKGQDDLGAKLSAHRRHKCVEAAQRYLLSRTR